MNDVGTLAAGRAPGNPPEPKQPLLYKYRTACQAIRMLTTRKVAFTCPTTFNDPLDCQWNPVWNGFASAVVDECIEQEARWIDVGPPATLSKRNPSKYRAFLDMASAVSKASPQDRIGLRAMYCDLCRQKTREREGKLEVGIRRKAEAVRVYCVSEDSESLPMWAHYSDEHKGVCIGIDWKSSLPNFGGALMRKVDYQVSLPKLVDDRVLVEALLYGDVAWVEGTDFRKVVEWKQSGWSYEREWRFVFVNPARLVDGDPSKGVPPGLTHEPDLFTLPEEAFAKVLLGPKCAAADGDAVVAAVQAWRVKPQVLRLSWRNGVAEYEDVKVGG